MKRNGNYIFDNWYSYGKITVGEIIIVEKGELGV